MRRASWVQLRCTGWHTKGNGWRRRKSDEVVEEEKQQKEKVTESEREINEWQEREEGGEGYGLNGNKQTVCKRGRQKLNVCDRGKT